MVGIVLKVEPIISGTYFGDDNVSPTVNGEDTIGMNILVGVGGVDLKFENLPILFSFISVICFTNIISCS